MSEFLTMDNLFALLGGLGLFLFGIKLMGDSLKALAGDNLKELINKYTSNKFSAVLVGILATIAIQSSSGTSALTISLVRAGLMQLGQAIGVIMGANIGTTVTAFLLGLKIKAFALPIIFIGAAIYLFAQKNRTSIKGQIVFGFGLLFYGMVVMETPLKALAATPEFESLMHQVATTPLLGVLIGAGLTMLVQSSSATIGILQGLYMTGMVSFPIAFSILIGDNIGTTITSLLASIGGSKDSKRAALSHVFFNIFGSVVFFFVMYVFGAIGAFESLMNFLSPENMELQIAFAHMFFNVTVTLMLVWFINYIERAVCFIVPDRGDDEKADYAEIYLDEKLVHEAPAMALSQGGTSVKELGLIVQKQFDAAKKYVETGDEKYFNRVNEYEIGVNALDKQLKTFLRDLTQAPFSDEDALKLNAYMFSINDIERIGDLTVNIVEKQNMFTQNGEKLSEEAKIEVTKMIKIAESIIKNVIELIDTEEALIAGKIIEKEKHLDKMERKYYKRHLTRVKEGSCTGRLSISYVDLISDIERIGDHGQNIAEYFTNTDDVLSEIEQEFDIAAILEH